MRLVHRRARALLRPRAHRHVRDRLGDSDFCPLAYKLRENNRLLIGLGVKEATSPLFMKACDEFIYLKPPGKAKAASREERAPHGRRESLALRAWAATSRDRARGRLQPARAGDGTAEPL